jgi:hypothetical protein
MRVVPRIYTQIRPGQKDAFLLTGAFSAPQKTQEEKE